jgi:hypothetical protein
MSDSATKPSLPNSLPSSITCLRRGRATHPELMLMGLCSMAPHVCRAACRVRVLKSLDTASEADTSGAALRLGGPVAFFWRDFWRERRTAL